MYREGYNSTSGVFLPKRFTLNLIMTKHQVQRTFYKIIGQYSSSVKVMRDRLSQMGGNRQPHARCDPGPEKGHQWDTVGKTFL